MVNVVRNALKVLDLLMEQGPGGRPVSLSELSRETGVRKTTLRNLLKTMVECGYLAQDEERSYMLGLKTGFMARFADLDGHFLETAKSLLLKTAQLTGESLVLATHIGGKRITLLHVTGNSAVTIDPSKISGKNPYTFVTTRLILAFSPENEFQSFVEKNGPLSKFWPEADPANKRRRLFDEIRKKGSLSLRESEFGSMAYPVYSSNRTLIAAVGLYSPIARFTPSNVIRFGKSLDQLAIRLSGLKES